MEIIVWVIFLESKRPSQMIAALDSLGKWDSFSGRQISPKYPNTPENI